MRTVVAILSLLAAPGALAGVFNVVPEPGILELAALAGIVAAIVGLRNRRK